MQNKPPNKMTDPSAWALHNASVLGIAHDYGVKSDHSTIVIGGAFAFPGQQPVIAVTGVQQIPLNTPPSEVCKMLREVRMHHGTSRAPTVTVVDASSNMAYFESVCQIGIHPTPTGVVFTGSGRHSRTPDIVPLGDRRYAKEYKLSRTLLLDELGPAMDNGSLIITNTGDANKLRSEFDTIQRIVTEARNTKYVTPNGTHDDLVISVAMLYWAMKQALNLKSGFTGVRHVPVQTGAQVSSLGWT